MKFARRLGARAAFTLVEVLVVLLIVSGIMLAMTQLLEAARISRDTIHNIQETQLAGPAIMDLIERDVRALVAYDRPPDQLLRIKNRVILGHDADRIDFLSSTDSVVATEIDRNFLRADLNEVGYMLRVNPADDEFLELYRREDFFVDEDPFEGGAYTFLHDHVKHFDIQVFEEDGRDAKPIEEWGVREDQVGLPKRIEIRLTLEIAPRLTQEQVRFAPVDMRTITYTRILRFGDDLLAQVEISPSPRIPALGTPTPSGVGGGAGGGPTGNPDGSNSGPNNQGNNNRGPVTGSGTSTTLQTGSFGPGGQR